MLLKIFSFVFNSALGTFDDSEFQDFVKDKAILSIREFFFIHNNLPYLTLVLQYQSSEAVSIETGPIPQHDSWKKTLTEVDMGLFNVLRDWRSKKSKQQGVPPYLLFTNRQFAEIVKQRPQNLSDLGKIDGIGKAKLDRYGADILAITKIEPETGK
jgi:superfamily II DNA helicase RecQ